MNKLFVLIALCWLGTAQASDLYLIIDDMACVDDPSDSMSIEVDFNGNTYDFDADCDWSFSEVFRVMRGSSKTIVRRCNCEHGILG